jgi:mono/diheme cytochrome c family protein
LTDVERWNVIFFEWAFTTTPAQVARGKQIYETQAVDVHGQGLTCAECHGTEGNGRGRLGLDIAKTKWNWARGLGPGIFTDVNLMAQRKPTDLFQVVADGLGDMPSYRGTLSDDDIWAVVSYIWTFIYTYPLTAK